MGKGIVYESKLPDENGLIPYTAEEDSVWRDLSARQKKVHQGRACAEYMQGLKELNLPTDRVPQLTEINEVLDKKTGFGVEPVAALITAQKFYELLRDRKFPVATFIRDRSEFDYLQEPDIFHEVYGHCPLLTNQAYADYVQRYGELALELGGAYKKPLLWLFWFTVEFGLIENTDGTRIYGAGILSSVGETEYATDSDKPERRPFDLVEALRTPYRIDIYQNIYYVIQSFDQLYNIVNAELKEAVEEAKALGDFEPTFPTTKDDGSPAMVF